MPSSRTGEAGARAPVARIAGLRLAPGAVPRHHTQAVREVLFQHGQAVGARVVAHAPEVTLVMPTGHWSAAPLLLLRHLHAARVTFVPVDSDAAALEVAERRIRLALPEVHTRPCLATAPLLVPPEAFGATGRNALFVPWCPLAGAWNLTHLAPAGALLGRNGCLIAGVQLRDEPVARGVERLACAIDPLLLPPDLRPVGIWCDSRQVAALVLLEAR